ncbi:cell wall-binding protein (plasmid) [Bacillus mycoides]|uniref:N-acetylmuramoyl-L-alanine amidase family protein n=1 Tax=Bacillus mycoides TaxID=1405 RepID=UPI001C029D55|nr:cell wall-binding protein [Bacillus mycoides]QWH15399.1 cell wall-binding protein [Bacillus mycoides]
MTRKFKTTGIRKKVIPATAALGILFSMAPIAENKASASLGVIVDVGITSLGMLKDIYEALGIEVGDPDLTDYTGPYAENVSYRAPSFNAGEFNISMHHTKDDSNFTRPVKVLYPNGKSEIHTLKSGQQLKITEAGTIVDLNPYAKSASEHNLLYITQEQLNEGKTGVALNQSIIVYVEQTSGQNKVLVDEFYKKRFGANSLDGLKGLGVDRFSYLTDEQKKVATMTSHPVDRTVLSNYVTNNPEALMDFHDRSVNLLANTTVILETEISLGPYGLNDGKPYQIIPITKGSNKVFVKIGSKYLSGKEGQTLQYSDSSGDDEVLELVQIENSANGQFQFHLINKNGVRLIATDHGRGFTTGTALRSEILFQGKTNNEIHNWLRDWHPDKENEKQQYDGIQIVVDEKDPAKRSAKDSSGNVIKNSWVNRGDDYFFADADGIFMTGWQDIEGKRYYFSPSTTQLITTSGYHIDGKYYHFNDDGSVKRSTWAEDQHGLHYSDDSGASVEKGLREIDGKIYYFQDYNVSKNEIRLEDQNIILHFSDKGVLERASNLKGEAINSIVNVTFDNKILAFNTDGSIFKTGINRNGNTLAYYSLEEGVSYTGWKMIDGKSYYFTNGLNDTFNAYKDIDGKRYYFHEDGSANRVGFEKIDGKLYHFDNNGVAQKGWQTIDNKYYYFDENGAAKTGWFNVGGGYRPWPLAYGYLWYCAREDGSLYVDGWFKIDGKDYQFDKWGHKM